MQLPDLQLVADLLRNVEMVHGRLVAARRDVLLRAFSRGVRRIVAFAQIHQVQRVELVDAEFGGELVGDVAFDRGGDGLEVAFDGRGDVFGDRGEEGADGGWG